MPALKLLSFHAVQAQRRAPPAQSMNPLPRCRVTSWPAYEPRRSSPGGQPLYSEPLSLLEVQPQSRLVPRQAAKLARG